MVDVTTGFVLQLRMYEALTDVHPDIKGEAEARGRPLVDVLASTVVSGGGRRGGRERWRRGGGRGGIAMDRDGS